VSVAVSWCDTTAGWRVHAGLSDERAEVTVTTMEESGGNEANSNPSRWAAVTRQPRQTGVTDVTGGPEGNLAASLGANLLGALNSLSKRRSARGGGPCRLGLRTSVARG